MAFLLIFIFVSATLLGAISGHYYVLPVVSFVVIPAMDTILGATRVAPPRWSLWIYYLPLQLYAVFHIFLIFWGCWWISTHELTLTEQVGLICSIGLVTGAVGINVSHEFIHRKSRLNRFLGEVMLVSVCYGHFAIEHIWGHHKNMATPMDPVSARKGETLYQFLPRAIIGSLACAYRIRPRRTQVYLASSFALALLLFWTFGPEALVLFLGQSWIAFSLLEITNYIEHYGLTRKEVAPGQYEPVKPNHSWDSDRWLTNKMLFHLQRHSDHHLHPLKPYPALTLTEGAPRLPTGYAGMMLLALVPPLWRRVMDPRLGSLHASARMHVITSQ